MDPPSPEKCPDMYTRLNSLLLKQLECPVCLETCAPPIKMCARTHIICYKCGESLTECATCRGPMAVERCWFAEQLYGHVTLPRADADEGSKAAVNVLSMSTHLAETRHTAYPCMIPGNSSAVVDGRWNHCPWRGQLSELAQHVADAHPGHSCDNNTTLTLNLDLLEQSDTEESTVHDAKLLSAFGCHFWYVVVCHQETKELEFIIFFVGPRDVCDSMSYKIVTGTKDTTMMIVRKNNIALSLEDAKEKSCKLKYRILKASLDEDGLLSYKLCVVFGKLGEGFQILSNLPKRSDNSSRVKRRLSYLRV